MPTKPVYYSEPYQAEWTSRILEIVPRGKHTLVALDETIFYPEGGGQPSDQGEIVGASGRLRVELVQLKDGTVWHQGKQLGDLQPGETVRSSLKWSHRFHNMRTHTAGHLIHDVLMSLTDRLTPLRGNHGSKAFIEYSGELDPGIRPAIREELERRVNETLRRDLPVWMKESSAAEIQERCRFAPPNLPLGKPLRTLQIGDFAPMPDGGVHVKRTGEIGSVVIQEITSSEGRTVVRYRITAGAES